MDYNPTLEKYRRTCIEEDRKVSQATIEKFVDEISNADEISSKGNYSSSSSEIVLASFDSQTFFLIHIYRNSAHFANIG